MSAERMRRWWSQYPTHILLVVSLLMLAVATYSAYRLPTLDPETLPAMGLLLPDSVRARLPDGGKFIVVSDYCATCRGRAVSYVNHVAENPHRVLVVERAPARSTFAPLVSNRLTGSDLVQVEPGGLPGFLHTRAVPVFVEINEDGIVTAAGPSRLGWTAQLAPSQWIAGWKGLWERSR